MRERLLAIYIRPVIHIRTACDAYVPKVSYDSGSNVVLLWSSLEAEQDHLGAIDWKGLVGERKI